MFVDPAISAALAKAAFGFGLMAAIAMACAVFIRVLVALLGVANARLAHPPARPLRPAAAAPAPVAVAARQAEAIDPGVVAAISAAVATVTGPHRIVWIGETQTGAWLAETRLRHHASHNPHHER